MAKLANAQDLKSCEVILLRVRLPVSALNSNLIINIRIIDLVKTNGKNYYFKKVIIQKNEALCQNWISRSVCSYAEYYIFYNMFIQNLIFINI